MRRKDTGNWRKPTSEEFDNIYLKLPPGIIRIMIREGKSIIYQRFRKQKELYEIIAKHSKQTYKKIWADSDRDYWMTAKEAKDYGMIDEVLVKHK